MTIKLPSDAMCRVVLPEPKGIVEYLKIFQWLDDQGLSKNAAKQFKHGKLEALVFDRVKDALLFKLTWGGE